jgi:transketolase N-terminal domain/subunit
VATTLSAPTPPQLAFDRERVEDIGFMTCMTLVLLGNYAQTGHFGGPLAYTPYNVALHLLGPELGGLRYDYRRPKHPYCDKFMLAGGHCIPTCYALWMILGQALARKFEDTGSQRYWVNPEDAMLPVDALGFRRGAGALKTLLAERGLDDHPLFKQAKGRGIRALSGHAESIDVTNDVNGGPSGVGLAAAAGKAAFWDFLGAQMGSPKVIALEGEFAMCEGHAQEMKTQALALQVGKRLRIMMSDNNAGIDDSLIGGVIHSKYEAYRIIDQWTSYGWNVLPVENGNDYGQVGHGAQGDGGRGSQGPSSDHHDRQDHQRLLAHHGERPRDRLSEPPLRDEDELGIFRLARGDVREALRGRLRRYPRRRRGRPSRAADPVQDQHRRRDGPA